jgi:DNA polymerase
MPQRQQYLSALGITDWRQRHPLQVQGPVAAIREATPANVPKVFAPEPIASQVVPPQMAAPQATMSAPPVALREARAPGTDSWETVAAEVASCTRCELAGCRTQTVFGVGDRNANWLVVGEAPGADEDRQGEPFVGRAGQLLNAMLLGIGLKREQVYIANVLKCRPPNNRDPKPEEVAQCLPYLERQIALLQPRIMLAVGRIAAQNLLATDTPIGKLRGRLHAFGAAKVPLVVTYHPAYLLRSPTEKRKAWEDLKFARGVAREQGA